VLRTEHPQLRRDLEYWNVVHEGEYFTFHTPYHLASNELPLSIVWAVEDGEATVIPRHGLLSEVIGAAKIDLEPGTIVKNTYMMYALNETAAEARSHRHIPYALLDGAEVLKPIKKDEVATWDLVKPRDDTMLYHLRRLQDGMFT
jgi:predicted homoserine dehydrogenase-like protein